MISALFCSVYPMGVIIAALPAHSWGAGSFSSEQNHNAKPNCVLSVYHFNDSGPDRNIAFHFSRCLLIDWRWVDYLWTIVMFLSAVWTLILTAPIRCRGSIGEQVTLALLSRRCSSNSGCFNLPGICQIYFPLNILVASLWILHLLSPLLRRWKKTPACIMNFILCFHNSSKSLGAGPSQWIAVAGSDRCQESFWK